MSLETAKVSLKPGVSESEFKASAERHMISPVWKPREAWGRRETVLAGYRCDTCGLEAPTLEELVRKHGVKQWVLEEGFLPHSYELYVPRREPAVLITEAGLELEARREREKLEAAEKLIRITRREDFYQIPLNSVTKNGYFNARRMFRDRKLYRIWVSGDAAKEVLEIREDLDGGYRVMPKPSPWCGVKVIRARRGRGAMVMVPDENTCVVMLESPYVHRGASEIELVDLPGEVVFRKQVLNSPQGRLGSRDFMVLNVRRGATLKYRFVRDGKPCGVKTITPV